MTPVFSYLLERMKKMDEVRVKLVNIKPEVDMQITKPTDCIDLMKQVIGDMVAGIFVLAAPIAVGAGVSVAVASHLKSKQLRQEKERLYQEALKKHEAIIKALRKESEESKERIEYLESLNILLQQAIDDLRKDLGVTA